MNWRGDPAAGRILKPCVLLALLLHAGGAGVARERLVYRLDLRDHLPSSSVRDLTQDAEGFIWIATVGGLARYDGVEVRPWAPETIRKADLVTAGDDGEVLAAWKGETLYEVASGRAVPVAGPDGRPLRETRSAVFASDGKLWVIEAGRIHWRDDAGQWGGVAPQAIADEVPRFMVAGPDGTLFLATDAGVWSISGERPPERLLVNPPFEEGGSPIIVALQPLPDGTLLAAQFCCRVLEVRDGRAEVRLDLSALEPLRAIDFALRGDRVWLSYDRLLVSMKPEGEPEILGTADGITGGGALLVDREGSLWMADEGRGVSRFPEPETVLWTSADGLPRAARRLGRTPDAVWVSDWDGLGRIATGAGGLRASTELELIAGIRPCLDGEGRLWAGGGRDSNTPDYRTVVTELRDGSFLFHEYGEVSRRARSFACAPAADGAVWIALGETLLRTLPGGGRPERVCSLPDPLSIARGVLEDSTGRLWVAGFSAVCSTEAPKAREDHEATWRCETPEGVGEIHAMTEAAPGDLWIGTRDAGVLHRVEGRWLPALEPEFLRSRWIHGLSASGRGGIWITGDGFIVRVAKREGGWRIVEELTAWNGIPPIPGVDTLEDDDGTLWIGTGSGVIQVPAGARRVSMEPPPVKLVDVSVDGEHLRLEENLELPYQRNRLELYFAALSYRNPRLVRYRIRHRADAEWSDSGRPFFRYVGLPPGGYRAEVIASLDGERWSAAPATFTFRVLPPWYLRWWALALFAGTAAAAMLAVYRARVAHLLGLERQRTRIAMDLHDEMGSNLGSIGILAELASDEGVDETRRRTMARKIAQTAGDLGAALTDIVWSLRPGSATLDALASHLAERGGRLFPGDGVSFEVVLPEPLPRVSLSLAVRRNLQLIVSEALHNAARHSAAGRVVLGLAPAGRRWRLWVEDDGRGVPRSAFEDGRGLGLQSMRQRAEEIGAEISWAPAGGRGTRVEVVFQPRAEDRRVRGTPSSWDGGRAGPR